MKEDVERNIDALRKMDIPELAETLKQVREGTIFSFIDFEKWLAASVGTDIFEICTGEKGVYYDRDNVRECLVIERKPMFKEKYVRILIKNEKEPMRPAIYTVPEYLVQTKPSYERR